MEKYKKVLLTVLLSLVLIIGGIYFYTKNKGSRIPENFSTFSSTLFSISFPDGWKHEVIEPVSGDPGLGGVIIRSPGTTLKYENYKETGVLRQFISVGLVNPMGDFTFQEIKDRYKDKIEGWSYDWGGIISERMITVDGAKAYQVIYNYRRSKTDPAQTNMKVILFADRSEDKNEIQKLIPIIIDIDYFATSEEFDKPLAERIINSLDEYVIRGISQ